MPRARNIKPGFFENDHLGALDSDVRLLFIALWTLADREGILEARISKIRTYAFRYRTDITDEIIQQYIHQLVRLDDGRVLRCVFYANRAWLIIHNFTKHQSPHHTESKGDYPTLHTLKSALEVPMEAKTTPSPLDHGYDTREIPLIPDSRASNIDPGFIDSRSSVKHDQHELPKIAQTKQKEQRPLPSVVDSIWLPEFEKFWIEYGRIGIKQRAKKSYLKIRKEGISYEVIIAGLRRYQSQCVAHGTHQRHIMHASTFLNPESRCWEDEYPIHASVEKPKQPTAHDNFTAGLQLAISKINEGPTY